MKPGWLAAVLGIAAGCSFQESNWRRVESSLVETLHVPKGEYEFLVSPVLPHEDLTSYVAGRQGEGWELAAIHPAGDEFPNQFLLTFRRLD